jgi:uncharacterized protein YjbI with pentapeptide repeats
LIESDFSRCDLRQVNLHRMEEQNCRFDGARMKGAMRTDKDLAEAEKA